MACVFAISDIHGCYGALKYALSLVDFSGDNKLVLLGDYVHGPYDYAVLDLIMELQEKYGSVIALRGNHENFVLDGTWPIGETADGKPYGKAPVDDGKYLAWMKTLPLYYVEGNTIFVHAGVDEEAGEFWQWSTEDFTFTSKYPAQTGHFYGDMKIVAGHIGTSEISGDPNFHDIYFDGESHYYIDGTVLRSGVIPVLKADTENNKYYEVKESGAWPILPYQEIK